MKRFIFTIFLFIAFFVGYLNTSAQELDFKNLSNSPQVQILNTPSVSLNVSFAGRVGQIAKVTASAENFDPNTSVFAWYLGGDESPQLIGLGKIEFSFPVTKNRQVVRVVVFQEGKKITENSAVVNAFDVSLTWSADTYTPPEYEGKALPTRGSLVTVVALPQIPNYSKEDLIYTWYVNGESQLRRARGAYEFSFRVTRSVDNVFVMVDVKNLSGSISLREAVNIPVVRPSVEVYYTDNLDSKFKYSFTVPLKRGNELFLIAKPYNFKIDKIADLSFIWKYLKRQNPVSLDKPFLLKIYADKNSGKGSRDLELEVLNKMTNQERAFKNLEISIN